MSPKVSSVSGDMHKKTLRRGRRIPFGATRFRPGPQPNGAGPHQAPSFERDAGQRQSSCIPIPASIGTVHLERGDRWTAPNRCLTEMSLVDLVRRQWQVANAAAGRVGKRVGKCGRCGSDRAFTGAKAWLVRPVDEDDVHLGRASSNVRMG